MRGHMRVIGEYDVRLGWVCQMIGVNAVDDIDVMTGVTERVRQTIDIHRIAAEAVWWIESRQMQEIERPHHCSTIFCITAMSCRAAISQVSWQAAARPAVRMRWRKLFDSNTRISAISRSVGLIGSM